MEDSVLAEVNVRPLKIPRYHGAFEGSSKSVNKKARSQVTLLTIEKQNEAKGTKLVLVEHIQANFQFANGLLCWLSFWAMDMNSSSTPEYKIYQAKLWKRGKELELHLFRLKPTEEEIVSIEVQPPSPMQCEDSGTHSLHSLT
ncbi:hypothetical protein F2Q69_00001112 [Brassica cretica]|uniref:Cysteine proteinase inhibitor n=1 Tax=Brassica cretica TaxID=69181 RepID=A0A8S9P5K3_BRACR|nr:hypothetical protein F2Q69_00001112 [Brassica cretica]